MRARVSALSTRRHRSKNGRGATRVLSSSAMAPAVVSAGPRPITRVTALSLRSATPTVTAGCCRRSRRGCQAGSTRPRRCSRRPRTWRARFGGPRAPTANMRSAPGRPTRTGPSGTPRTWQQSRPARSCRRERRLRRHRPWRQQPPTVGTDRAMVRAADCVPRSAHRRSRCRATPSAWAAVKGRAPRSRGRADLVC